MFLTSSICSPLQLLPLLMKCSTSLLLLSLLKITYSCVLFLLKKRVVQALSNLGSTRAPGPDGFTALFFKQYWSVVKDEVLGCIKNFFQNHFLLQEQNQTYIALILKQSSSHIVHHFRPISLCNIVYKIITKIVVNRLKTMHPKIISPLQSAFVPCKNF